MNLHLVPDWRNWWRWASTWLNAALAAAAAWLWANPAELYGLYASLTPELRQMIGPVVGIGLFAVSQGLRLWKQNHPPRNP